MKDFELNVRAIRERARQHIENGAVTQDYRPDRETAIKLLNDALATEIVCVLRYKLHYQTARGVHSEQASAEFKEHAQDEQKHVDWLAERIDQLNGKPDFNPKLIAERSHTDYVECDNVEDMLRENIVAERIAIELYREMIRYFGNDDPTTRRLLEHILKEEEEHADDLAKLLPSKEEVGVDKRPSVRAMA